MDDQTVEQAALIALGAEEHYEAVTLRAVAAAIRGAYEAGQLDSEERIRTLEAALEWERDAPGVLLRQGHEPECARVRWPRGAACDCDTVRRRRACEKERLEASLCVQEVGSATGPTPRGAWLAEGRRYCDGKLLRARHHPNEHQCQDCGTIYQRESFAARGAIPPSLVGVGCVVACARCGRVGSVTLLDHLCSACAEAVQHVP